MFSFNIILETLTQSKEKPQIELDCVQVTRNWMYWLEPWSFAKPPERSLITIYMMKTTTLCSSTKCHLPSITQPQPPCSSMDYLLVRSAHFFY